ncbi:unnamed protein product [Thelazia callipaeda]|uniref:Uncharacterized protein n=1 Tax=Thelazia callipaeda TaxID=103827 RepID=A0A0N5CLR4_THECL|nr:unnamed protein product [Thelazia callipaeda]
MSKDKDGCGETCFNGKQSGNGNKADRFIRSPLGTMRFGKRGNAPFNPMRFGKSYDSDDLSTILSMTYENDGNNNAGVNNDYPVFEGNPFYLNSYQKRRNPLGTMRFGK